VGIADHATIGAGAMVAAQAGIASRVPAGGRWGGTPAVPADEWKRGAAILRRLARRGKKTGEDGE
jgi:UDP-3-O-[3-hydroxymyristoyl] glucosamine N-acyltransferase